MRSYDFDPEQSVSIVAIFLFIDAAFTGLPLLNGLVHGAGPSPLAIVLVVALIAGGVGLLKHLRWGWFVSLGAVAFLALVDLATLRLFGILIDALVIFLLTRPSMRARFGVRR
jgi:phosphoglycerol transferase MdoB-like AlkP superfamily enzyme